MIQLIGWQIKKLFIKNGGLFLVLLYVGLIIFVGMLPTDSFESPSIRVAMSAYYQAYGGKLTQQTSEAIEHHYQEILNAESVWDSAVQEYYNQTITMDEFNQIQRKVQDLRNEKRAFEKFYTYYQYSAQQPGNRYLVDTQGWSKIMEISNLDYLLVVFSIFLIAMIDKADAGKNIVLLIKTTRYGKGMHLLSKWVMAFICAVIILFATITVRLLLTSCKYDLTNYNVPLQSMSYFSYSTYGISILQGFVLASMLQLFGLTFCNVLTVCLTEACSNVILGSFAGMAASLLPYFVFYEDAKYLQLPFPTGLLQGFSYLHSVEMGRMQTIKTAIIILLIVLIGLILFSIYLSLWKGKTKQKLMIVLCIPLMLSLCGCNSKTPIAMTCSTNDPLYLVETDDYYVYKQNEMMVREKASGKEHPLLDDPLETNEKKMNIRNIKAFRNTLYFMYLNNENLPIIQSINLDNGERKTIFEEVAYGKKVMVFDVPIWEWPGLTYDQICNLLENFLFVENELILLRRESITVVRDGTEDILYEGRYWDVSSNGTDVFFVNSERSLCCLDPATGTIVKYTNIMPTTPKAYGEKVLYLDTRNSNALMTFNTTTSKCEMLFAGPWSDFQYSSNYIILKDSVGALWLANPDSTDLRLLYDNTNYRDYRVNGDEHTLVILLKDGTLHYIPLDQ